MLSVERYVKHLVPKILLDCFSVFPLDDEEVKHNDDIDDDNDDDDHDDDDYDDKKLSYYKEGVHLTSLYCGLVVAH